MPEFIPFFKRGILHLDLMKLILLLISPSENAPLSLNTSMDLRYIIRQFSFSNFDGVD